MNLPIPQHYINNIKKSADYATNNGTLKFGYYGIDLERYSKEELVMICSILINQLKKAEQRHSNNLKTMLSFNKKPHR